MSQACRDLASEIRVLELLAGERRMLAPVGVSSLLPAPVSMNLFAALSATSPQAHRSRRSSPVPARPAPASPPGGEVPVPLFRRLKPLRRRTPPSHGPPTACTPPRPPPETGAAPGFTRYRQVQRPDLHIEHPFDLTPQLDHPVGDHLAPAAAHRQALIPDLRVHRGEHVNAHARPPSDTNSPGDSSYTLVTDRQKALPAWSRPPGARGRAIAHYRAAGVTFAPSHAVGKPGGCGVIGDDT